MQTLMPVVFVSHGGGPLPLMGAENHRDMIESMQQLAQSLPKPKAIVMISAHWETEHFTVNQHPQPDLYFDYYNFPDEAYSITYPASGNPELAQTIQSLLEQQSIVVNTESERGLDHGVFVPLKMLFPAADVPIVQVSLAQSLDPTQHIELGKALQVLRLQGVMIMGSGMTTHNFSWFRGGLNEVVTQKNEAFHAWLDTTLVNPELTEVERGQLLAQWEQAPYAQEVHPREEHLIPLHVCYGAAEKPVSQVMAFEVMGLSTRCYCWN